MSTGLTLSVRTCIPLRSCFVAYTAPFLPRVITTVSHPMSSNLCKACNELLLKEKYLVYFLIVTYTKKSKRVNSNNAMNFTYDRVTEKLVRREASPSFTQSIEQYGNIS